MRAQKDPKRVVFADPENYKMLKAAEFVCNQKIAIPVLLGDENIIMSLINEHDLEIPHLEIINPRSDKEDQRRLEFAKLLFEKRQRKGITMQNAVERMLHRQYFGTMLVETGYADAVLSGLTNNYPEALRPAIEVIGIRKNSNLVSGMYIINSKQGPVFFADCTVNKNPTTEQLVEIALQTAFAVKQFNIEPRVALVTYSNFGSNRGRIPDLARDAVAILHRDYPELIVDGEMQANVALNPELIEENFSFSKLRGAPANILVFPYLTAGNIAYKLMQEMGKFDVIGPVINGMSKSVHILQMGSSVTEIINMVMVAVIDAQGVQHPGFEEDRAKFFTRHTVK